MSEPIPRYTDMYASEFFSPDDFEFGKPLLLQITGHEASKLKLAKAGRVVENWKMVLLVSGAPQGLHLKKLAINKTSFRRLKLKWGAGAVSDDWVNTLVGQWISVGRDKVNGKDATLATPAESPGGVKGPSPSGPTKKEAGETVMNSCGGDRPQATELWKKLTAKHGSDWAAIIKACLPDNAPETGALD